MLFIIIPINSFNLDQLSSYHSKDVDPRFAVLTPQSRVLQQKRLVSLQAGLDLDLHTRHLASHPPACP